MQNEPIERVSRALVYANMLDVGFSDAEARAGAYEEAGDDWKVWESYARAALQALPYVDGVDEAAAIGVSAEVGGIDAVTVIECYDGMVRAFLSPQEAQGGE